MRKSERERESVCEGYKEKKMMMEREIEKQIERYKYGKKVKERKKRDWESKEMNINNKRQNKKVDIGKT